MGELSRSDSRRIEIVEDALLRYSLSSDSLGAAVEAMQSLLETDKAIVYSLHPRSASDDLEVGIAHVAPDVASFRGVFDEWLVGKGVDVASYNAIRPEAAQRNRVMSSEELRRPGEPPPRIEELYPAVNARGHHTLRMLVCEGSSLLAWVGMLQPAPPSARQRRLLRKLLPAFRQRLRFERWVRETAFASGALPAALEQIAAPAWVLGPDGRVVHANDAGRTRLDRRDGGAVRRDLRTCAAGRAGDARLKVARFSAAEGQRGLLVVDPTAGAAAPCVADARRRFGLTPAQSRVLDLVARGLSNATIAAELTLAERTVEAHVTAILDKAQVPSRAALIATLLAR
jgi:DNA-binding CsgD family transcriptional regulator